MKKYFIYVGYLFLIGFVLYNSVYFEKLDQKKQQDLKKNFNPKEAVDYFWKNKLSDILNAAIEIEKFDSLLAANPEYLIQQEGKSVGISSNFSFLVSGSAITDPRNDAKIQIVLPKGNFTYKLILKYIFGNAARDAVGYFNVDDFENTMDFNAVSSELNSIIEKHISDDHITSLTAETIIKFIGALEINSENIQKDIEIIPLSLEIIQ